MRLKSKMNLLSLLSLIGFTSIKAQDWADLNRFKEANHLLATEQRAEDRIVFMGNSITIGWLNLRPEFFEDKPYVNRGISGQTTPQMLVRFRQDVVDLHPKVVVLLAGTNDIAGNTGPSTLEMVMDNIKGMSEIAQANGIKVILSSTLPAYDYPWKPGLEPSGKIIALNKMIKAYTEAQGHIYLDYFSAMVDNRNGLPKKYAEDEVHPTAAGYQVMEPLVDAAIEKALSQ
jgi:lysophospholipase L1-like esterase